MKKHLLGPALLLVSLTANAQGNVLATPACEAFKKVAHGEISDLKKGLQTDQLLVIKDGQKVYEWTDGAYKASSLHSLWSASKTVTATLIAAAIQKGDLSLDTKLNSFFPRQFSDREQQRNYDAVTIENLVNMSAGFKWDESYESNPVTSTFIPMLYGKGQKSMHQYALSQDMETEPGRKWNYSGGNSNILMAILRKIYGNTNFPKDLLFNKIGITSAVIESDASGDLVGSSYIYMNTSEMAKLGQLYLNNGAWNGEQILPVGWVADAQIPTPAITRADSLTDPAYVKAEGVFSSRVFWLNQDVPNMKMEHEFKNSPRDMFFAAGHYGQIIIILPTQKMVITATGHNKEYWSKIDGLVSKTVACFSPETVATPSEPTQVASSSASISSGSEKTSVLKSIALGSTVLKKEILQAILAKEVCSCVYVTGLDVKQCLSRANLPMSEGQLKLLVSVRKSKESVGILAEPTPLGWLLGKLLSGSRLADYLGQETGCRLVPYTPPHMRDDNYKRD